MPGGTKQEIMADHFMNPRLDIPSRAANELLLLMLAEAGLTALIVIPVPVYN